MATIRSPKSPAPYAPCVHCGCPVLKGRTDAGEELFVETDSRAFVVVWDTDTPLPRLVRSQAYPVHDCLMGD